MTARKMRLGLSIRDHGYHPAARRYPAVPADGTLHVEHYVQAQTAWFDPAENFFARKQTLKIRLLL